MYDWERDEICKDCPLKEEVKTPRMDGYGPVNARIVLVGEAPGAEEDDDGKPFIGRAGRLLRRIWLEVLGFPLDDIFLTNIVRCRPPNNRTPKTAECRRCFPFVEEEIEQIKPELVIAVGNPAMHTLGIKGKITVNTGKVFQSQSPHYKTIIPLVHPSYILQNQREMPLFRHSLESIKNYLNKGHKLDLGEYEIVKVGDHETLTSTLDRIRKQRLLVFDIETNGLNVFMKDPRIKCISFAWKPKHAVCFPTEGWDDVNSRALIALSLKEIFENPSIKKSGQRLGFEYKWLKKIWGVELKGIYWDSRIAAFELDKLKSAGLKDQAWSIGLGGYERMLPDRVDKCEGPTLFKYCAMDSDAEYRLMLKQENTVPPQMRQYIKKLALPLTKEFGELHLRGLRVDFKQLDKIEELGGELVVLLRDKLNANKWIKKTNKTSPYGDFNPNSARHVRYLLYGVLGAEVKKKTKEGAPSTDKETLGDIRGKYPSVIDPLLDYRTTAKFVSTYIKNMRRNIGPDGRIHATFSQTTARSGRSATENPNVQNWPHLPTRIKKFPKKYWEVFAPRKIIIPDEGCEFGEADFGQQELRVAAAISKDPVMTQVFLDGKDIHDETAISFFPDYDTLPKDRKKEIRRIAKVINFGIIYGISAHGIVSNLKEEGIDLSEKDAQRFIRAFLKKYYRYAEWTEEIKIQINEVGYIDTPTGRRRNFPPVAELDQHDREAVYREAVNTPIQGAAYDLLAIALVRFSQEARKRKFKSYICNTIHDSNIFNIFPGEHDSLVELYNEIAINPPEWINFMGDIPLVVDWEFVPRWGEKVEE